MLVATAKCMVTGGAAYQLPFSAKEPEIIFPNAYKLHAPLKLFESFKLSGGCQPENFPGGRPSVSCLELVGQAIEQYLFDRYLDYSCV